MYIKIIALAFICLFGVDSCNWGNLQNIDQLLVQDWQQQHLPPMHISSCTQNANNTTSAKIVCHCDSIGVYTTDADNNGYPLTTGIHYYHNSTTAMPFNNDTFYLQIYNGNIPEFTSPNTLSFIHPMGNVNTVAFDTCMYFMP